MKYKIVPFTAQVSPNDNSEVVAWQLQMIIDSVVEQGWDYVRIESVHFLKENGSKIWGMIKRKPHYSTFTVLVFSQQG